MPKPRLTAGNARNASENPIDKLGFHGGYKMTNDDDLKVSVRMLLEVLAGRMTVEEMNEICGWHANPFERALRQGRLIAAADVVGSNDDDDWIKVIFGQRDPAISPFR